MKNELIPVYFVPGLAASSRIFEFLQLSKSKFETHLLEWLIPTSKTETLEDYAKRMCQNIKHKNFILVGVSFGGIVAQEMCNYCNPIKTILISSIKHENELPKRLKTIRKTKAYKLAPVKSISNIESFAKYAFSDKVKKKVDLYKKYLAIRDETYLTWAIYNVLHWQQKKTNNNIIHIHGDKDHVFPIKNIPNCIPVKGGTHAMILYKAKKISTILNEICDTEYNHKKN